MAALVVRCLLCVREENESWPGAQECHPPDSYFPADCLKTVGYWMLILLSGVVAHLALLMSFCVNQHWDSEPAAVLEATASSMLVQGTQSPKTKMRDQSMVC